MSTLYRAFVSSTRLSCEFTVFFENSHHSRLDHIEQLMCLLWDTRPEDLQIYDICSEAELLTTAAFSGPEAGDLRLLETGWFQGPLHAAPERTLILTSPITARRLQGLQQRAQQVQRVAASDHAQRLDRHAAGAPA